MSSWSLDSLYPGFNSTEYQDDVVKLDNLIGIF